MCCGTGGARVLVCLDFELGLVLELGHLSFILGKLRAGHLDGDLAVKVKLPGLGIIA